PATPRSAAGTGAQAHDHMPAFIRTHLALLQTKQESNGLLEELENWEPATRYGPPDRSAARLTYSCQCCCRPVNSFSANATHYADYLGEGRVMGRTSRI